MMKESQNQVDIILVLGGGISKTGQLPTWVLPRLNRAQELFRNGVSHKILLSGKGRDNFSIAESEAMREYLINHELINHEFSPHDLLLESLSKDTLQNAYYSRVIHMDPLKMRSALVITSQIHIERTKLIFDTVLGHNCSLFYEAVSDEGLKSQDLELRALTEGKLESFYRRLFQSMPAGNLKALHSFIFDRNNIFYREYEELGIMLKDKMVFY